MQAGGGPRFDIGARLYVKTKAIDRKTAAYSEEYLGWAQSLFTARMASDRGRVRQGRCTLGMAFVMPRHGLCHALSYLDFETAQTLTPKSISFSGGGVCGHL
jgi:hypothetical protein